MNININKIICKNQNQYPKLYPKYYIQNEKIFSKSMENIIFLKSKDTEYNKASSFI